MFHDGTLFVDFACFAAAAADPRETLLCYFLEFLQKEFIELLYIFSFTHPNNIGTALSIDDVIKRPFPEHPRTSRTALLPGARVRDIRNGTF